MNTLTIEQIQSVSGGMQLPPGEREFIGFFENVEIGLATIGGGLIGGIIGSAVPGAGTAFGAAVGGVVAGAAATAATDGLNSYLGI